MEGGVRFAILATITTITNLNVFPYLRDGKMWFGVTRTGTGVMWFRIPDELPAMTGQKTVDGVRYQTIGNSIWLTNLDHGRRHEPLDLMTMEDLRRYSSHQRSEIAASARTSTMTASRSGSLTPYPQITQAIWAFR